jgi:hypothetical protein
VIDGHLTTDPTLAVKRPKVPSEGERRTVLHTLEFAAGLTASRADGATSHALVAPAGRGRAPWCTFPRKRVIHTGLSGYFFNDSSRRPGQAVGEVLGGDARNRLPTAVRCGSLRGC